MANAIDIRVRPHGSARRFAAKVQTYGPDVDLALVKIEDSVEEDFWAAVADAPPVELAEALPELQDTIFHMLSCDSMMFYGLLVFFFNSRLLREKQGL